MPVKSPITQRRGKRTSKGGADDIIVVPDKLYFRIGEVSELLRLPASVLRFWETEFPQLKPTKSSTGQRLYRKRDVETLVRIKHLLYVEGFTIPGARQFLKEATHTKSQPTLFAGNGNGHRAVELKRIKLELESVRDLLKRRS
ncbi:MAG TPA: MerR family transcriptional regulator [Terriglobales bacterium]|jgi:DNA-binding transcriptional MerR regulator